MVVRQWAWFVVLMIFGAGAGYGILRPGQAQASAATMGAALLLAAGLRLWLGERSGLLRVRTKATDIVIYVLLGIGIVVLAFWVPEIGRPVG
jgi:membrane protease YdiL (CAAX protease family)